MKTKWSTFQTIYSAILIFERIELLTTNKTNYIIKIRQIFRNPLEISIVNLNIDRFRLKLSIEIKQNIHGAPVKKQRA